MKRNIMLVASLITGFAAPLAGQATGTPSFNAPYRAFSRSEFGGTVSFPRGANFGLEGQYRFGYQNFDVGLRGGLVDYGGGFTQGVIGAEARGRVLTHTEEFPLDGAVIVGLGGRFSSGASSALITGGLSLGRRIDPKDSQVSIVPYGEPVLFISSGGGGSSLNFAMGFGADLRLSRVFDLRVSVGLGDIQGAAFSAVWVH
jgi:hypothetical protein